jgi:hypothetical protein
VKNGLIKISIFCCLVTLVACGSGSGSSDTSNSGDAVGAANSAADQTVVARINAANAEQLGIASATGVAQAVQYQQAPDLGLRPEPRPDPVRISMDLSRHFSASSVSGSFACASGSYSEVGNPDGSTTVSFNLCDIGFGLVFDGDVHANSSTEGNLTTVDLEYVDFSVDLAGNVTVFDFEASCTTDNTTTDTSCAFPDAPGFDGRLYNIFDASVVGDGSSGYSVTATIVDPDHGSLTIATITPILFGCADGQPSSGALQFTDGNGVPVSVTFNDCASFTLSYSGTSEVYNW